MNKLLFVLIMLLIVKCDCKYKLQQEVIDSQIIPVNYEEVNTLDEVTVCVGREKECIETLESVMEQIPVELQDTLVDTLGRMEIVVDNTQGFVHYMDNNVGEFGNGQLYAGIALYGYAPKTLVYGMADDYVITHELGHVYDYSFKYKNEPMPSSTDQWQWAYENDYISEYGTTSVMEFYAECFSMYFRYPNGLKLQCPLAYRLMEEEFGHME